MSKVFETADLHAIARLAVVQIIDHVAAVAEVNDIEMEFLAHRINEADQILLFLLRAIEITLLVNEPGNLSVRAKLRAQLVGAQAGGMHKVGPPMIVRLCFIFFPLLERWSADEQDIFASNSSVRSGGECRSEQEKKWKKDQVTSFHQELWEHYLC